MCWFSYTKIFYRRLKKSEFCSKTKYIWTTSDIVLSDKQLLNKCFLELDKYLPISARQQQQHITSSALFFFLALMVKIVLYK